MIFFFVILLGAFVGQIFLPWWVIIPVCLAASFWRARAPFPSFLIPFLSIFSLWLLTASYLSIQNDHLLANRIAQMFNLPVHAGTWLLMAGLSALPGAITAGFSGLSGFFLRKMFVNR